MSLRLFKPVFAVAAVMLATFSYTIAATEAKPESAAAAATTPPPLPSTPPPVNPRLTVIARISDAARQAMAASADPVALVLTAKYVRDANMQDGEQRDDAEKANLQAAALAKAMQLAGNDERGFVGIQVSMFCLGFPAKALCSQTDPVLLTAEAMPDNAMGWMIMAGRDFSQGLNVVAQTYLQKAAKAKTSDWFYKVGAATALKFAKAVNEPLAKPGDTEAAAFEIMNSMTLPAFKRFSQMCNPDPKGKLPAGRYKLCRQVARLLIDHSETHVERLTGHYALERLALGEKKPAEAKRIAARIDAIQAAIQSLWKSLVFPPQNDADGEGLVAYFADFVQVGEVKATASALKKAGKNADVFSAK